MHSHFVIMIVLHCQDVQRTLHMYRDHHIFKVAGFNIGGIIHLYRVTFHAYTIHNSDGYLSYTQHTKHLPLQLPWHKCFHKEK